VNIITRHGRALKGFEASGEAGSFDTYKARLTYGNRIGQGSDLLASASGFSSKGQDLYFPEYDTLLTNNGVAVDADYDRAQNAFVKYGVGDVTVTAAYSSRTKGIPTGAYGTDFNDTGNRTIDGRAYVDAAVKKTLGAGRTHGKALLTATVYRPFKARADKASPVVGRQARRRHRKRVSSPGGPRTNLDGMKNYDEERDALPDDR
jgi:hypothetical protein